MKTIIYQIFSFLVVLSLLCSCSFDNYDEPSLTLNGRLLDGNESLNTKRGIAFKLFQYREDGFISAGSTWINVYVDQEGKFSSLLFPGRYKMVVNTNNGDIEDPDIYSACTWEDFPKNENTGALDTLFFTLDNSKIIDFQVKPYYKFRDMEAFYRNDSVIVRFAVNKLIDSEDSKVRMRKISVFLSPTMHVNRDTEVYFNLSMSEIKTDEMIEYRCYLKDYYSNQYYVNNYRDYVYIRLGASTMGYVNVFNYSPIIKLSGIPQETIKKFK